MFRTVKSLLAGLIAGTALGVLFAPGKGDEIRKKFKAEVEGGGTGLKTVTHTLSVMGHDISGTAKDTFDEFKKTDVYKQGSAAFKKEFEAAKKKAAVKVQKATVKAKKAARSAASEAKKTAKKAVKKVQKKLG